MSNRLPSAQRAQQKQYDQHVNDFQVGFNNDGSILVSSAGKRQNFQPTSTTVYVSQNATTNGRANLINHSDVNGNSNYKTSNPKLRSGQEELLGSVNFNGNGEYNSSSAANGFISESRQVNNVRGVNVSNSFTQPTSQSKPTANIVRTQSAVNGNFNNREGREVADNAINGDAEDEEFAYSKGIVNKLRQKFQVTKDTEMSGMAKRAQSCENLSKKANAKEVVLSLKETSENQTFHIVHSADDLIMESHAQNKNSVIITLQDTVPPSAQPSVVSKAPVEENCEYIPPNVVASTKVLFEKYSNAPSSARRQPVYSTIKPAANNQVNGISASVTNLYNGKEAANVPKNAYAKANGSLSVTNSYSSLDRNSVRRTRHEQSTTAAKGFTSAEKVGNGYNGVMVAHSVGDLTTVGQTDRERRSSSADRNSLNLDFSQPKKPDVVDGGSDQAVVPVVSSENSMPRRNRPNPAVPGKLVIRPASNLMPAATSAESLKLTTFNDIKTGEFEPASTRKWSSRFDGVPTSSVEDGSSDSDVDGPETGNDAASPGISREGESGLFRSSYNFEGAGVILPKSALSRSKKNRTRNCQFSDTASTHEYPSEQTLLELMPPEPSDEQDNAYSLVRRGSLSDEEDEEMGRSKKGILAAPATLATSGGLGAYKSKLQVDYQFGSSTAPSPSKPSTSVSQSQDAPVTTTSDPWSGSASSSDLLF